MEAKEKKVKRKITMSPGKVAAMAKAQAQAKEKLKGTSPRARGLERAHEAIKWVYYWGFSTPTMLEIITNSFSSGLANRLCKSGLMSKIETPSGGINSTPTFLLTLTERGLETALEITDEQLPYVTDPHRINIKNVNHDLMVQRLTAFKMKNDVSGYKTPKHMHEWNSKDIKIPDAVWLRNNADGTVQRCAVEVELTPKVDKEFDRFITMTSEFLHVADAASKENSRLFSSVEIFMKSPAALKKYTEAFQPNVETPVWQKEPGKTGRWVHAKDKGIPVFSTLSECQSKQISVSLITKQMVATPAQSAAPAKVAKEPSVYLYNAKSPAKVAKQEAANVEANRIRKEKKLAPRQVEINGDPSTTNFLGPNIVDPLIIF